MRIALVAASLALVAGTTAGCGGPPTDASLADFCEVYDHAAAELFQVEEGDVAAMVEVLKDFAEELEQIGTPEGIPEDARAGFELTLEMLENVPDDATEEDLDAIGDEQSEEESRLVETFDDWADEACREEEPTDAPGEEGSE